MNTYVTLACLLAAVGLSHGSAIGYGLGAPWYGYGSSVISAPILAPAAVSTQNLVKAAPIPVIRSYYAPVPIVKSVPIINTVPVSSYGLGINGLGLGHGLGYGGIGLGWGAKGLGWGNPWLGGWGLDKH